MKIVAALTLTVGIVASSVGCSPLAPRPDRSRFFILTPVTASAPESSAQNVSTTSQLTLGIGPIDLPGYLRRPELVTLTASNQIDISDDERWAEPLDKNFSRVLTENLARLLGTNQVEKYPWSHTQSVDYQVIVDVQRFDTTGDHQSQLVARWTIKDGHTGKDLYASETALNTPVASGDGGDSAALSANLATLSREIASRISILAQSGRTSHGVREPHDLS